MTERTRRILSIVAPLLAVLALLGAGSLWGQRQARLRGALNGLPDAHLPARVPVLGVNVDLTQYSEADLAETWG